MAKLAYQNYILEIIPTFHYYRSDGSDTSEYYYNIIIHQDGKPLKLFYHYLKKLQDVFEVETMDRMISETCLQAIYTKKDSAVSDLCNDSFLLDIKLQDKLWEITLNLALGFDVPYFTFALYVSEQDFFEFSEALRFEEGKVVCRL
ncbi:TPA: hypothetical protein QB352_002352 [Pasteurella multocida]|nr:hypothetical protein [Pasteurella multocida]